jgi:hypothetical protein
VTTRLLLPSASVSNQSGWEQMKCVICAPGVLKRVRCWGPHAMIPPVLLEAWTLFTLVGFLQTS